MILMAGKQKTIKRILVGTDFSRPASNAIVRAVMLAAEHSAKLEILHVAPSMRHLQLRQLGLGGSSGCDSDAVCEEHLTKARDIAVARGVIATLRLMKRNVPAMLMREADPLNADLIVLGYHGNRSLKSNLIGTTVERVMERWTGDTLAVRNPPSGAYDVILACGAAKR